MSSARMALFAVAVFAASCGQGVVDPQAALDRGVTARLTQDEVLPTGAACAPNGAHGKHAGYECKVCHVCGGVLAFDPLGPAVAPGLAAPAFDAEREDLLERRLSRDVLRHLQLLLPGRRRRA